MTIIKIINNSTILSFLLCLFFIVVLDAQDSSINKRIDINRTVSVIPFDMAFSFDEDDTDYSLMLTERIQGVMVQSRRFIMVERIQMQKSLKLIKDINIDNPNLYEHWRTVPNSHLVEAGKQLGIEFIITGSITNVTYPMLRSGGYGCDLSFTIKALSVETGKVEYTESISVNTEKLIGKNSKREALNAVFEKAIPPLEQFVDKYFPVEAPFYKIKERDKKGRPKTIIIKGGMANGLRHKQDLDISVIVSEDYKDKIGEVEIIEIEEKFSICKVKYGAEQIKQQAEKDSSKIIARSITHKRG